MTNPSVYNREGRRNLYTSIEGHVVSTGCIDQYSAVLVAKQMKEVGLAAYRQGNRTLGDYLYDLIESHLQYLKEVDGRKHEHTRKKRTHLMMPVEAGIFHKLKDVRKQSFEAWWNTLTCGEKTRGEYMTSWNVFLDWLVYEGKLIENPIKGKIRRARIKRTDKIPRRAFTEDEVRNLLAVAGVHELRYLIAYVTGIRFGELKQLLWSDVFETATEPHIKLRSETTKNGKARKQYLTREAAAMLAETRAQANTNSVFPTLLSNYMINKHIKLAGIPKMTEEGRACFHSLRHTFTTNIARMTGDVRLAQSMADHADITTTQGYLHTEQREHIHAMSKYPSVRSQLVPGRAVKRAVVTDQSSLSVSKRVPTLSNENGTQMTTDESLSAVKSNPVQGWVETERGGFEPPMKETSILDFESSAFNRSATSPR